jgi:hypothetical protein
MYRITWGDPAAAAAATAAALVAPAAAAAAAVDEATAEATVVVVVVVVPVEVDDDVIGCWDKRANTRTSLSADSRALEDKVATVITLIATSSDVFSSTAL